MKYEEKVGKVWALIAEWGITDWDLATETKDHQYIVSNIYLVRDALMNDLETDYDDEGETVEDFLNRHNIEWV